MTLTPVEFTERFAGLTEGKVYRYESAFDFRAGSYSWYNYWRNELAKLAGNEQTPYMSFNGETELRYDATVWKTKKAHFGSLLISQMRKASSAPLHANEFTKTSFIIKSSHQKHPDEYFRTSYQDWMKAFSMCANNGAIVFY
ncbi:hypothetical protein [Stutzerimonas sp. CQPMC-PStu]|uniref:hypothetical protein n=1 Tax=Stutzerimonas sp. CQPMC-PStu TaxID=3369415 RepID=UPI00371E390F